jgi:hypothetical protein
MLKLEKVNTEHTLQQVIQGMINALPMIFWPWKYLPVRSGGRQALHHLGEIIPARLFYCKHGRRAPVGRQAGEIIHK